MSLCINGIGHIEKLPASHPLQRLELRGEPDRPFYEEISWADLNKLGLSDVQTLSLRYYALSVLFSACDSGWRAETLEINYADAVGATLVHGARRCEMHGLVAPREGAAADRRYWDVKRLLFHRACLGSLVRFATSIPRLESIRRFSGLLPHIVLPNLTTFTLLCGRPNRDTARGYVERWESILDYPLLGEAGVLRAPQLRTIRLQARVLHPPEEDSVISPSALALFITKHIQMQDGRRLPELRVDGPTVQFSDDPDGLAALGGLVESIHYRL
ncbi:hypothetical protein AURDEDRAFT_175978 [Auricularia subglabra TFB-10046 SS5]|nr:hypothetical protein AURDEDRAFT_175978 [Auricularia subglabra TFB-10046 SS5]